jgi:hypothetical protein
MLNPFFGSFFETTLVIQFTNHKNFTMKKILLLFAATGLLTLTGCNNDDDVVVANTGNASNETFEVGPINFTSAVNTFTYPLNPTIGSSDVVLIYRLSSNPTGAEDVWEPVPASYEFDGGAKLTYNTDFSVNDIAFYLNSNFNIDEVPQYALNQYFRVVVIKGFDNSGNKIDYSNYNAVVKHFNAVESDRGNSTRK